MPIDIPPQERLIVALDFPDGESAMRLVAQLGDAVRFYKIGLELIASGDGFRIIRQLADNGKRVFADMKLFDVPPTVARATAAIADSGADFLTVHGDDAIMQAAAENKGDLKILAVTVLTSLDDGDIRQMGFACDIPTLVLSRAKKAMQFGCDGVIASGQEAAAIRKELGANSLIVTPGIRPAESQSNEQKRIATPADAISAGANYLVVGRPIRNAENPRLAAEKIQREIADSLSKRKSEKA